MSRIDVTTTATLMATIGRIDRFASPRQLVGYLGLDPRSRQSGLGAVQHGHISKQGSATARHVLCEAAHMRSPGPLRAFGQRVRNAATPAQWKAERQDAQRVEDDYRAAVADWKPQRPPSPVT